MTSEALCTSVRLLPPKEGEEPLYLVSFEGHEFLSRAELGELVRSGRYYKFVSSTDWRGRGSRPRFWLESLELVSGGL